SITGDTTVEPDETFTVTLTSPTNATIATGTGTVTIRNDDSSTSGPPIGPTTPDHTPTLGGVCSHPHHGHCRGLTGVTEINAAGRVTWNLTATFTGVKMHKHQHPRTKLPHLAQATAVVARPGSIRFALPIPLGRCKQMKRYAQHDTGAWLTLTITHRDTHGKTTKVQVIYPI
ncbi:hypothetical protein, partial [Nocardioides sp. AN3]